jgi:hypothetical protein
MRRHLRRLFTFLSVVSLLLCVATCALWVRSCWVADALYRTANKNPPAAGYDEYRLWSSAGLLVWQWDDVSPSPDDFGPRPNPADLEMPWNYVGPQPAVAIYEGEDRWHGLRAGYFTGHPLRTGFSTVPLDPPENVWVTNRSAWAAHWMVAAATAILPLVVGCRRWRATRRAARLRAGICPACGYDLRASPDRCPECGTVVATRGSVT